MKIRSITLENVRRFLDPTRIAPVGDGITLLCEPNESGKSTLFDAIHALFFQKHTGKAKAIKTLQPHSGGPVTVEMELEIDGVRWRLRKRWMQKSEAKVWKDGVLVHQAGEADDWITRLTGVDGTGPAGLLWVRQGLTGLDPDSQSERDDAQTARRDLFSSVAGAVDDVTGGRRMDQTLIQCRRELDALATSTGRKKSGGRWDVAETALEALIEQETELDTKVRELAGALADRRRLRKELNAATDPDVAERRRAALESARSELREAERHAYELERAETEAKLARQTLETAEQAEKRAIDVRKSQEDAEAVERQAAGKVADVRAAASEADLVWSAAEKALKEAQAQLDKAGEIYRNASRRDRAQSAADRRRELSERLKAAEQADRLAAEFKAQAAREPTGATMKRLESLAEDVRTRAAVIDAAAPKVMARYDPGAPCLRLNGEDLKPDTSTPIREDTELTLPGIGVLAVSLPAGAERNKALATARAALKEALALGEWRDLDAARAARAERDDEERKAQDAEKERDILAPNGLQHLRETLAQLPEPDEQNADLPDTETAELELGEAQRTHAQARQSGEQARETRDASRLEVARAEQALQAAKSARESARTAVANLPADPPGGVERHLADLQLKAEAAEQKQQTLASTAPNLETARARTQRQEAIKESAAEEVQQIEKQLARIDTLIATRADEGVEETLAEVRQKLDLAREDLDRVLFERDVLTRLNDVLEQSRKAARDHYFAPVTKELAPLLQLLWPDAELIWSDDSYLPSALRRPGVAEPEPIDILSGGTQEQVAFFVRLAFAKLLAKDGRPAPLILDDALVFSDDDRIERMFEALHQVAGDIQILVLSCRQRAFRELGASKVRFECLEAC